MAKAKKPATSREIIQNAPATHPKVSKATINHAKQAKKPKATKVKKPPPKLASDDDSDSDSDVSPKKTRPVVAGPPAKKASSDSDSDSEDEAPSKAAPPKKVDDNDSSSSSESDSDSDDGDGDVKMAQASTKPVVQEAPSKKAAPTKKVADNDSSSSSESDSDSDEGVPDVQGPSKAAPTKKVGGNESSSSSEGDSDEDEDDGDVQRPSKAAPTKKVGVNDSSSSSSSESDSDSDSSSSDDDDGDLKTAKVSTKPILAKAESNSKKRKAQDEGKPPTKITKLNNGAPAAPSAGADVTTTIFVGRLSWSVDNDRLAQEFAECGQVESANVQMDRDTGKSRGFGYVRFKTAEAVEKALAMNGREIDGRAVNIDRSSPQTKNETREKRAKSFGDEISPPSSVLFVGNLSFSTSEDTVWGFFNDYGVKSVRLPTDRDTGRPKGYGYVEFEDIEGAQKAFEDARGAEIDGRSVRLDYSQPRDSNNFGGRGGGRGGRGGGRGEGRGGWRGGGRGEGRGGGRGGRGGWGGDGFGRGASRGGRGGQRGGPRRGGMPPPEGKKTTF